LGNYITSEYYTGQRSVKISTSYLWYCAISSAETDGSGSLLACSPWHLAEQGVIGFVAFSPQLERFCSLSFFWYLSIDTKIFPKLLEFFSSLCP
jgi:hypothetical protein